MPAEKYHIVHADISIEYREHRANSSAGVVDVRIPKEEQLYLSLVQGAHLPDAVAGPLRAHPRHALV